MHHFQILFKDARFVLKKDELGVEIFRIALPTALALLADPVASLIDTAFIGRIGPVELAAVGVAIAVFNQVSKICIFPLVSVTTSYVAEEDTFSRVSKAVEENDKMENGLSKKKQMEELTIHDSCTLEHESYDIEKGLPQNNPIKETATEAGSQSNSNKLDEESDNLEKGLHGNSNMNESAMEAGSQKIDQKLTYEKEDNSQKKVEKKKRHLSSASSAIVFGGVLGVLQAILLIFAARPLLYIMGVKSNSPMLTPAREYLILRSLGSPAILLSLAMQGIFRGFKDTKTPFYAIVLGDVTNVILDPILMFIFHLGVRGAALAHIISQYLIALILLVILMRRIDLLPRSMKDLQFARFLKSGSLLLGRVIAVTICVTLAASMAARLGSTPMAAFQILLQLWMTLSLLNDGLAVAGQALLASAFAEKDHKKAINTASRVLQLGLVTGFVLSCVIGIGLRFGSRLFTRDVHVLKLISIGLPFVAAMQPINALSFVLDGVNFGASDFTYSALSTVFVAILSIPCLFLLAHSHGFVGIWIALTIYMGMRTFVGFGRIVTATGPWRILKI